MYYRVLDIDVCKAAERRIVEAFKRHKILMLAFSGGKDSICTADMVVKTMQKYGIAFNRLIVVFFDEEAIYPDIERITLQWRSKFLALGAKFYWFAMPYKHFNCCNKLANDETFICWDPKAQDRWVRPKPKFAISNHAKLKPGMNYQAFSKAAFAGIPNIVGLRTYESIQRQSAVSSKRDNDTLIYPLYDWRDDDIWLYIKRNNLEFPETYLYLYKCGVAKNKLRISQFFSIDTIKSLPKVLEFYPDLYERIQRREPNIDLVMLYGETEMFRSSKQAEKFDQKVDYKVKFKETFKKAAQSPEDYPGYKEICKVYSKVCEGTPDKAYQEMYEVLIAGDPKGRSTRRIYLRIKQAQLPQIVKTRRIHGKFNGKKRDSATANGTSSATE